MSFYKLGNCFRLILMSRIAKNLGGLMEVVTNSHLYGNIKYIFIYYRSVKQKNAVSPLMWTDFIRIFSLQLVRNVHPSHICCIFLMDEKREQFYPFTTYSSRGGNYFTLSRDRSGASRYQCHRLLIYLCHHTNFYVILVFTIVKFIMITWNYF